VTEICAVVLAAGMGLRLRPLTDILPKALCPVGNVPLLDRALEAVAGARLAGPATVAVNASWLADQVVTHVGSRAAVSVERGFPLGTAGALGKLRDWIAGRGVLVGNADAYLSPPDLADLLQDWDGTEVRLLGIQPQPDDPFRFGRYAFAGFSLLPWSRVARLPAEPAELVHEVWRPAESAGKLRVIPYHGRFLDIGTPARYLAANLHAAGRRSLVAESATVTGRLQRSVVGAGAVVHGRVTRSVVWPDSYVGPDERLVNAIRAGGRGRMADARA
jgi:NDP-sugar pyrophosphorylase family protein